MIDETNFKQVLFEYTLKKYENKIDEFHDKFFDEFPYDYNGLSNELHFKNFIDWLMIEKTLPDTGKTIIEGFVSEHPELSEEMKQKLLNMKKVIRSEFVVLSKNKLELMLKDRKTGDRYPVKLYSDVQYIGRNTLITGRIHPFGAYYRFAGAFLSHNSPMILDPEVMMTAFMDDKIKDAESLLVSSNTKLTAVLNKYPSNWVDGICLSLGLSKSGKKNEKAILIHEHILSNMKHIISVLPQRSKEALKIILGNNGFVKYSLLKGFDDKLSFFWESEEPASDIGVLRVKGLLVIGKCVENGRKYKMALIPADLRESMKNCLMPNLLEVKS